MANLSWSMLLASLLLTNVLVLVLVLVLVMMKWDINGQTKKRQRNEWLMVSLSLSVSRITRSLSPGHEAIKGQNQDQARVT